jgi:Pyridoxamine 5'-phosphate oxidase
VSPEVNVLSKVKLEDELAGLQELIDRSLRNATPALADSVAYPARQMSATEFVEFWHSVRLVAIATVGEGGRPHIAPVNAALSGTTLRLVIYDNTVRRGDLARNPRVAFSTWRADGAAAIVYGRAREVEGSLRPARPGRSGKPRQVVEIEVKLTRVYAMRPPSAS